MRIKLEVVDKQIKRERQWNY